MHSVPQLQEQREQGEPDNCINHLPEHHSFTNKNKTKQNLSMSFQHIPLIVLTENAPELEANLHHTRRFPSAFA